MDTFDLNKTSNLKVDSVIRKKYGGRFSRSEQWEKKGIGVGKLLLYDEDDGTHFKSNIELVREGLVIYYRNLTINKAIILGYDEVESISLIKEDDILVAKRFSIFKRLLKMGVSYYNAKIFLLEPEIINEYKPELTLLLKEYDPIKLIVHRRNPHDVADLLQKIDHPLPIEINLLQYKYAEQIGR